MKVARAGGEREEPLVESLAEAGLAREWEWEETPEVSLKLVDSVDEAVALFNRYSPQFDASLVSEDPAAHEAFYQAVNAPFVGCRAYTAPAPTKRRSSAIVRSRSRSKSDGLVPPIA